MITSVVSLRSSAPRMRAFAIRSSHVLGAVSVSSPAFCTISAFQHVAIGRECVIADRVMLIDFDHGVVEVELYKLAVEMADRIVIFGMMQLVGAHESVVDPAHHLRHRVRRVERLVRVGLAGQVPVRRHLPARQVDGLQPRLHHLHRLVAGDGTERAHGVLGLQEFP